MLAPAARVLADFIIVQRFCLLFGVPPSGSFSVGGRSLLLSYANSCQRLLLLVYSPLADESIRLEYRILERLRVQLGKGRYLFINYLEIHPRHQLAPGEYAIIGDSLLDIATFRIQ